MGLNAWFRIFHKNIYMKNDVVEKINLRYRTITKRINKEYLNSNSYTNNSFILNLTLEVVKSKLIILI